MTSADTAEEIAVTASHEITAYSSLIGHAGLCLSEAVSHAWDERPAFWPASGYGGRTPTTQKRR